MFADGDPNGVRRRQPADEPPRRTVQDGRAPVPVPWLGELHELVLSTEGLQEFLHRVAALAVQAIPTRVSCGITVQPGAKPLTIASSDGMAVAVDEIQYSVGDGPCLTSMREGKQIHVRDLLSEQRWPSFTAHALAHGVRSILSVPLSGPDDVVGALNVYAADPDIFDDVVRRQVEQFAATAAGATAITVRLVDTTEQSENLRRALVYRSVIDQAIGIVMAQNRCSSGDAFGILRQASQNRNEKLRDIAARLVDSTGGVGGASMGGRR